MTTATVTTALQRGSDSPWVTRLARLGLVARGLVYGLVGLLAVQVAFGRRGESADQQGAFRTLADHTGGRVVLWLAVAGFLGYAVWLAADAAWGHRAEQRRGKRVAARLESAGKTVVYLALAVGAARAASGAGGDERGDRVTARLLAVTGGRVLVVLAGLVLLGVGVGMVWRGARQDFTEQIDEHRLGRFARTAAVRLGQVGYLARGVVFGLAGGLVVAAALTTDPGKARGLDVALAELARRPFGTWLLVAAGLGLVAFGAYSLVEARLRRL